MKNLKRDYYRYTKLICNLFLGLVFSNVSYASCSYAGKNYAAGKSISLFTSASVAFGSTCKKETLVCKTTGTGKNKKDKWHVGKKVVATSTYRPACQVLPAKNCALDGLSIVHGKSADFYNSRNVSIGSACATQSRTCHNGVLSGSLDYKFASCQVCAQGEKKFTYTHTDADLDGLYKAQSGEICVKSNLLPPYSINGVRYNTNVVSTQLEPLKCDSDFFGRVLVAYGAVDRDGDSYFTAEVGEICLSKVGLPAQKMELGKVVTYASTIPLNSSEPSAATDLDPNIPVAQPRYVLVSPSVDGSGLWNGYDYLNYDSLSFSEEGKAKFYYLNSSEGSGREIFSIVGGSGLFQYSIISGSASIDGEGNFQFNCSTMFGEIATIQIRDLKSWQTEEYQVYSYGDDSTCNGGGSNPNPEPSPTPTATPTPEPTPEEELCQPPALNVGELPPCRYPEPDPDPSPILGCMDPAFPNYNPEATQDDGSCEKESKCQSEEDDPSISFDSVPASTIVTIYGYEGDPYWDSASAAGIASCTAHADLDGNGRKDRVDYLYDVLQPSGDKQAVQDWLNGVLNKNYAPESHFLKSGDIALSPDLSGRFNCGDVIEVKIKTGEDSAGKPSYQCFTGRVWDKTADYLSGRVDIYSPSGSHEFAGKEVVGVRVTK